MYRLHSTLWSGSCACIPGTAHLLISSLKTPLKIAEKILTNVNLKPRHNLNSVYFQILTMVHSVASVGYVHVWGGQSADKGWHCTHSHSIPNQGGQRTLRQLWQVVWILFGSYKYLAWLWSLDETVKNVMITNITCAAYATIADNSSVDKQSHNKISYQDQDMSTIRTLYNILIQTSTIIVWLPLPVTIY